MSDGYFITIMIFEGGRCDLNTLRNFSCLSQKSDPSSTFS